MPFSISTASPSNGSLHSPRPYSSCTMACWYMTSSGLGTSAGPSDWYELSVSSSSPRDSNKNSATAINRISNNPAITEITAIAHVGSAPVAPESGPSVGTGPPDGLSDGVESSRPVHSSDINTSSANSFVSRYVFISCSTSDDVLDSTRVRTRTTVPFPAVCRAATDEDSAVCAFDSFRDANLLCGIAEIDEIAASSIVGNLFNSAFVILLHVYCVVVSGSYCVITTPTSTISKFGSELFSPGAWHASAELNCTVAGGGSCVTSPSPDSANSKKNRASSGVSGSAPSGMPSMFCTHNVYVACSDRLLREKFMSKSVSNTRSRPPSAPSPLSRGGTNTL
mmetsp:Transcript_10710/g.22768  ORF Transcript_10710/g.22768 Transcript_10710/m.22768 type:complete len:338 (-) Transcript_10710:1112-2125(-)